MNTLTNKSISEPLVAKSVVGKGAKMAGLLGVLLLAAASLSQAQVIWYLHANMASGASMTPGLWFDAPVGGTAAVAFSGSDTYNANGYLVRSNPAGTTNFTGGTLISGGGTGPGIGSIALKGSGMTVTNFETAASGGGISNSEVNVVFSATTMTLNGNLALGNNGASFVHTMSITAGSLSGSGDITLAGGSFGFVTLGFGNATGYTGDIFSTDNGFIDFSSSFATGGGLSMAVGTRVQDFTGHTITVTSLDVGGTVFAPGTYTYAQIKATNATTNTIFSPSGGGPTGGTIVVIPEPSAVLLLGLGSVLFVARRNSRRQTAA